MTGYTENWLEDTLIDSVTIHIDVVDVTDEATLEEDEEESPPTLPVPPETGPQTLYVPYEIPAPKAIAEMRTWPLPTRLSYDVYTAAATLPSSKRSAGPVASVKAFALGCFVLFGVIAGAGMILGRELAR